MTYYLQMDGVDDRLQVPPLTFNEIIIDFIVNHKTGVNQFYFDARTGGSFAYIQRNTSNVDNTGNVGLITAYINNVMVSNNTAYVPTNQRSTLKGVFSSAVTDNVTFFNHNGGNFGPLEAKVYNIKLLNNGVTLAHYDMTTQTVQDQSGNGNHATLTGGTWIDDGTGGGVTPTPIEVDAGTLSLSAASDLTSNASNLVNTQANMSSVSNLIGVANRILNASSVLSSTTNLDAEGEVISIELSVNLFASSGISANATRIKQAESTLSAGTSLSADGDVVSLEVSVNLSASSTLTANCSRVVNGTSTISANGQVVASGTAIYDGESSFVATSNIDPIILYYSQYRQVIPMILEINIREINYDLNVTMRKEFNFDVKKRKNYDLNI